MKTRALSTPLLLIDRRWLLLLTAAVALILTFLMIPATPAEAATCQVTHIVQRGETLSSIARRYGMGTSTLAQANGITNINRILAGQALCIPSANPTPNPVPACQVTYTVATGDTLAKIGRRFNISWRVIAEANKITNPNRILVGQKLCIPTVADPPAGATPSFSIVSVIRNQSVTIQTANFPANETFEVRMGLMGTRGANGTLAGTFKSTQGSQTVTITIPAGLRGLDQIAIRADSPSTFAYNWFWNN